LFCLLRKGEALFTYPSGGAKNPASGEKYCSAYSPSREPQVRFKVAMTLRNQYLYQLKGTFRGQQLRRNPTNPQPFYQVNITCETNPQITKISVFQSKVSSEI
jgi:hypothetical protein